MQPCIRGFRQTPRASLRRLIKSKPLGSWILCTAHDEPELCVRQQTAFLYASALHCSQDRLLLLGSQRDAQFLCLNRDAVQAALLAEDDLALRSDQIGRERLNRLRDMKLAGHGTALAHK